MSFSAKVLIISIALQLGVHLLYSLCITSPWMLTPAAFVLGAITGTVRVLIVSSREDVRRLEGENKRMRMLLERHEGEAS